MKKKTFGLKFSQNYYYTIAIEKKKTIKNLKEKQTPAASKFEEKKI